MVNLENEVEEICGFLFNTESIPQNNKQSKNEILTYIINNKNIEIFSDYEKCKSICKSKNEFFIVSETYMKSIYRDFKEIEGKKVKINL